jgi:prepilin-type N-terminal cleavage/methylation domain-containing protein
MNGRDAGVSLVEVLVGMALFGVLTTILLGVSLSTSQVTEHTRQVSAVNAESQLVMERLTRELRQASTVTALHNSTGATDPARLQFQVDFDGEPAAGEPANAAAATVQYTWDPATGDLTITEGTESGVLAEGVTRFTVTAGSTLWQYDANGDGDTTWQELNDAGAPVGDADNPAVLDVELPYVDRVEITMTVERDIDGDPFEQTYATKVDMRNVIPIL